MLAYYPQGQHLDTPYYQHPDNPTFSALQSPSSFSGDDFAALLEGVSRLPSYPSMPTATTQHTQNPPIRLHHSSPTPSQNLQKNVNLVQSPAQMLANNNMSWESQGLLSPINFQQSLPRRLNNNHKRGSSGSSVTSAGPPSPLNHTTSYPQVANPDPSSYSPSVFEAYENYGTPHHTVSKSLPTPVHTPIQPSYLTPDYQNFNNISQEDESVMRRAYWDQQASADDDAASFAYSGPHSASTMSHNSPATPHTTFDGDMEDSSKTISHGENMIREVDKWMDEYLHVDPDFNQIPGLNRTMSKVYQDELYQPPSATSVPQQQQQHHQQQQQRPGFSQASSHLTPYRKVFADRLQAMNQGHITARSQSPTVSIGRERSPFREGSEFAQPTSIYAGQRNSQAQVHSAAQLREQQKAEADAIAMAQHQPRTEAYEAPKTISPKDAVLEYHETPEDAAMPLFPQGQPTPQYSQQPINFRRDESSFGMPSTYGQYSNPLAAPQMPQQYPFLSHRQRQQSSMQSLAVDQNPEFPAHLTSMESTASEAAMTLPPSSQNSTISQAPTSHPRPEDTSSDAGTYTCTYHGCTLRFETPAKLQKHKRDAHRQTSPSAAPSPGGMTSTAAMNLRNSQAGPHKCDRINPSTGKPCNSIFSRPYDLTRHEDTIHNNRKMKVRCHLCTEEKTFSRNDALTRHMRVVHPDVDWPGKTKRKNARD